MQLHGRLGETRARQAGNLGCPEARNPLFLVGMAKSGADAVTAFVTSITLFSGGKSFSVTFRPENSQPRHAPSGVRSASAASTTGVSDHWVGRGPKDIGGASEGIGTARSDHSYTATRWRLLYTGQVDIILDAPRASGDSVPRRRQVGQILGRLRP